MVEEKFRERTCRLHVMLHGRGNIRAEYHAGTGAKRSMSLTGWVEDTDEHGHPVCDSRFHRKQVSLTLRSPPDSEWLTEMLASFGGSNTCGLVDVEKDVKPKRLDLDGSTAEFAPISGLLEISADAFDAIHWLAMNADNQQRLVHATLALSGNAIPQKGSACLFLKDLDVSTNRTYTVTDFKLSSTTLADYSEDRVLRVEPKPDEGYGTTIRILLERIRYEISTERASVYEISCEGRVLSGWGNKKPYDGAHVSIEFREFECNKYAQLPESAFYGSFFYGVKESLGFSFDLYYVTDHAHNLLIPILRQELQAEIILNIRLTNEEEDLLAAEDELRGNVRDYTFTINRHFGRKT